jgi:hypothetical protein
MWTQGIDLSNILAQGRYTDVSATATIIKGCYAELLSSSGMNCGMGFMEC